MRRSEWTSRIPKSSDFRRLLVASSLSEFGDWSARIALAAMLLETTNDPAWVGMVPVVFIAPRLGVGQYLTSWSERLPRKPVLVTCDSIRAVVFIAAALLNPSTLVLLALVLIAATLDPVFESNASAASFDVLSDTNRDDGVRLRQIAKTGAQVAGLGLTGVALRWMSPNALLLTNSLTFGLSAAILARTNIVNLAQRADSVARTLVKAGRSIIGDAHIRAALATTTITIFAATAAEAQVVFYAAKQPSWVLPVASAAIPLLATIAIAIASTNGGTQPLLRRALAFTSIATAGAIAAISFTAPVMTVIAFACVGAMFQTTVVGQVIAVRHLPTDGRASVLSLLQTVVLLGSAAGAAVSGFAINAFGHRAGIQICLAVTFMAWLIPLPSAKFETQPKQNTDSA